MVSRLLREFIHEMFGLERYVTMNALSDMISGPDLYNQSVVSPEPVSTYEIARAGISVIPLDTDHLVVSLDVPTFEFEPDWEAQVDEVDGEGA